MSEIVAPRQRGMTPVRVTLTAGVPQRFEFSGDYVHILTAPVNDLKVRFDGGEPVPMYQGVGFRRHYGEVEFESDTGQSIVALVGFGSVADGRSTANVSVTTTLSAGNTFNKGGDVVCTHSAATQLLAADTARTYAQVCNASTNTITVRLGPSSVDAASGILLEPGESATLGTTAAIYAYNPDVSTDVTLSVASISNV